MSTLALIDGDIVLHRCAVVFDTPMEQTDKGTYKFDITSAIRNARGMLQDIAEAVGADRSVVCLTGSNNYRKEVCPTYKGNRTGRKPILFAELREKLVASDKFETIERPGLEADDLLGILATHPLKAYPEERKIICSIDKDLRTVPGLHWNWDKQMSGFDEPDEVHAYDGELFFYRQILTGDSTDGYAGCPGIGPKTAEKILVDGMPEEEFWPAIVAAYEKEGLTEEDALVTARCARILRAGEYDFKKKEPVLWTPPSAETSTAS